MEPRSAAIKSRTLCGPKIGPGAWPAIDEEIEFTAGCSGDAAQALATAFPGAVRGAAYGEPAPLYRDEL